MSEILCRWLNDELRLSQVVEPKNFAKNFSSGYLIGEVLHKYHLQKDFSMFSRKDTSTSRLSNFTRLEPTLQLLGVSFDMKTAQDLMQEKAGVATHLLYQLYVLLEKKKKPPGDRTATETVQPAASATLRKKERDNYSDVPKPLSTTLQLTRTRKKQQQQQQQPHQKRAQQAQTVQTEIAQFEKNRKKLGAYAFASSSSDEFSPRDLTLTCCSRSYDNRGSGAKAVFQSSKKYIEDIRQRLQENTAAREQREKRIDRFLAQQRKVHEAHEEAWHEEQLVERLTRQTQQEQRLTAHLLQIRCEKEVMQQNRLFREQQYQQRRERDFQEALEKEAALAQQFKLERAEEVRKELEFSTKVAAQRAKKKRKKQFNTCQNILLQIVDLATKIGEYRLLTGNLIPNKLMKEWMELLLKGLPLYEPSKIQPGSDFSTPSDPVELKKQETLNNQDYDEYTNMVGDWAWPEEAGEPKLPPTNNDILGHVIGRLRSITPRPRSASSVAPFPQFKLKACVLGKFCSGKSTCLSKIAKDHGIHILSADKLIDEALNAHKNGEEVTQQQQENTEQRLPFSTSLEPAAETQEKNSNTDIEVTQQEENSEQPLLSSTSLKPAAETQEKNSNMDIGVTQQQEENSEQPLPSSTSLEPAAETQEKNSNIDVRVGGSRRTWREPTQTQGEHATSAQSGTLTRNRLAVRRQRYPLRHHLSARAKLGKTVEKELRRGSSVPNELLVNIIVEAIRQIPAQSGWILDGFPSDITQAHLLEEALCDSVDVRAVVIDDRVSLAVDPNPPKPPHPPAPALDLVLLLDVPDECAVRRALSLTDSLAFTDKTLYLAQMQHRINTFQDTLPKLETWFGAHQNILARVDADVEEEKLYLKVESVLQQVMVKIEEARAPPLAEDVVLDNQNIPESYSSATSPPIDQPPPLEDEASGQNESHSNLNADQDSHRELSRRMSSSSETLEDIQGVTDNSPESASPCPGSSSWVYVDEPIPPDIPEYLCFHWNIMCDSYVNNIKIVMQQLRSQRNAITHHLYNIREEYKHYLGHPHLKQELVLQWQKDFNSFYDDMREDEETKAELHLRLDELCERLWDIGDKRKEENEQEKDAVMGEGWLEEHTMVFINHHSVLMQVELDRFQITLSILRVYYMCMYNQILPEQHPNFGCIPLLNTPVIEDQGHPDSPNGDSNNDQDPTESVKLQLPHEKLVSDYEEAIARISKLVCAEVQQMEAKEQDDKMQEKESSKNSGNAKKAKGQSSKKQKGQPSSNRGPSPAESDDKTSEKGQDQEVIKKILKEYVAALNHEENAAKVRITLVKGHGLAMVQSLKIRAEKTSSCTQKWLEEHYVAEMQSIEQLTEVVRHHIETGAKLQNELVLDCTDFYLHGGHHMVASPLPPPRPPCLEKPMLSTPTISQLESLHHQFHTVAPSGLMSMLQFSVLLRDIVSVNMGDALPEPWINKSETQVMEIVCLLKDECDLIDWRRFLLSAALPWPFPSLTQLLVVLQQFKAADVDSTGFINSDQYLQTELWFSGGGVHPVPEDPTEPLPYDRLANLHKFFFMLFADQSSSPPHVEYVSMLQYFAADPHPKQGFIRALSIILGQNLKLSSPDHITKHVQSMPTIEEAVVLSSSEHDSKDKEEEIPGVSVISGKEQEVSIPALLDVICHKITRMKEGQPLPPGCLSQEEHNEHLVQVFRELGYEPEEHIPFSVLCQHPFIQGLMDTSVQYQLVDIHRVLLANQGLGEPNSLTPS
ncbi:sperm flagellar protein 2 [Antennarius striatus]|uniref:sperm flagellar protein 2 n=1 Tax=Antennarius striatus TaxID=241820 RepID=UPI0035B2F849